MPKKLKWFILSFFALIVLIGSLGFFFLRSTAPVYNGKLILDGLTDTVSIRFDQYGIPHIDAANESDAYFALGYAQAQDRLFQMDMLRRATSGRLAEVLGPEMLETDKIFLTLGLKEKAEQSARKYLRSSNQTYQRSAKAYLKGVNQFMRNGTLPIEYHILDLPRDEFEESDIYAVISYLSLGFSYATKEDAMISFIANELGEEYIADFKLSSSPETIDSIRHDIVKKPGQSLSLKIEKELNKLGLSQWWGSNSWVLGGEKTNSGKVIFANDTHMGYSQPATWYEAHIKYPGFELYGHYLPLIPFSVLGHNRDIAWGLTIFPFDNVNYYVEQFNPEDSTQLLYNEEYYDIVYRKETIKVKGEPSLDYMIRHSKHGPIINETDPNIAYFMEEPVALWWTVLEFDSRALEGMYLMNQSDDLASFRAALPLLDVVGLYVNYGDAEGNIAWWAAGKIPLFRAGLEGALFLDGTSGMDDPIGFQDFSLNPQVENPDQAFIATANNDPVISGSVFTPGNYLAPDRINRLNKIFSSKSDWKIEDNKKIQLDHHSDVKLELTKMICDEIVLEENSNEFSNQVYELFKSWNGSYDQEAAGPIIYEKMVYHITRLALSDELEKEPLDLIYKSFLYERSINSFFSNDESIWWDNIDTKVKETRSDIITAAFKSSVEDLKQNPGKNLNDWRWGDLHQLTFPHAFGDIKALAKFFNVGPFKVGGGNNVLNKMAHPIYSDPNKKVLSGPTVRILIDFDDVENGLNVHPTGQSGNVMSEHYKDQAQMFIDGKYRKMMMDQLEINEESKNLLFLLPKEK